MRYLKQSTTVNVQMGPALDKTDGVTEETALSPTVYLTKNGGAQAARNSATAISHDARGYYIVELDGTDTGTVGHIRACFHDSATHLPVWEDFIVLPANVYDSLIAGTDLMQVDTTQVGGTAQTAADLKAVLGAPAGASVSADIAAVKVDTAATLADTGTDGVVVNAASLAADAATEIANAVAAVVVESAGSYTIQQVLSILLAVLAGVTASSGATIKTPDGTATRVAATINASSERTAMTLTPSA